MNRKAEHQRDRTAARRMAGSAMRAVFYRYDGLSLLSLGDLEQSFLNEFTASYLRAIRIGRKRGPIPRVILPRFTKRKPRTQPTHA